MLAFADRFGVRNGKQLRALFSGRVNVIKQGLDQTYAKRLVLAIESIGGISRMELETPQNALSFEHSGEGEAQLAGELVPSTYPSGLAEKLEQARSQPRKHISPQATARRPPSPFGTR